MLENVRVLDVHGHLRAIGPTSTFLALLLGSNTAFPSPIRPAAGTPDTSRMLPLKRDEMLPMTTDEDFRQAAEKHAKYLEERNIDAQIVGPHPVEVHGWLPPHLFAAWTSYVNDMIFKICQARPDRFVGAAQLPQRADAGDAAHMIPELERCLQQYGFVATYVSPDPTGDRDTPGLHEHYWDPLYEYCADRSVPIIVHATGSRDRRFVGIPHSSQLSFVTEHYFATMFLRHSDVFARHPALRILVCHCGGALDRFTRESVIVSPHADQDLSNNLFFDTCAYDVDFLAAAIKQRTPEQMCFGSEAPGAGFAIRADTGRTADDMVPVFAEDERLAFLTDPQRNAILSDNPLRFCPDLADPIGANARATEAAYPTSA